jgi:hypothetical protein
MFLASRQTGQAQDCRAASTLEQGKDLMEQKVLVVLLQLDAVNVEVPERA